MDFFHYLFKYIIVGDSNVGKSCLLLNFTEKKFKSEHDTTIGVEFGSNVFKHKNKVIKIQIWDTVIMKTQPYIVLGRARVLSLNHKELLQRSRSIGVILQFDITNRKSFLNLAKWKQEVIDCVHDKTIIYLVGNKLDLEAKQSRQIILAISREVSYEEAKQFSELHGFVYFETSAKTGERVEQVFHEMAMKIYTYIETNSIDYSNDVALKILKFQNFGIKLGNFFTKGIENSEDAPIKVSKQKEDGCC